MEIFTIMEITKCMREYHAINMIVEKVDIERWKDTYDRPCEKSEYELAHVHKHVKRTGLWK